MRNKSGQTRQRTNNLRDELHQVTKIGVSLHQQKFNDIAVIDIFNNINNRKCCNYRCPDSVLYTVVNYIFKCNLTHSHTMTPFDALG